MMGFRTNVMILKCYPISYNTGAGHEAEETAQLAMCLPYMNNNLTLDSPKPCEKQGITTYTYNRGVGEMEGRDGSIPGCSQAS